jgi:hypothetical protein
MDQKLKQNFLHLLKQKIFQLFLNYHIKLNEIYYVILYHGDFFSFFFEGPLILTNQILLHRLHLLLSVPAALYYSSNLLLPVSLCIIRLIPLSHPCCALN